MPTLNKPKKKTTYKKHTANAKAYNHTWSRLRNYYISCNPLCAICLGEGKTVPAEEVHHKIPISTADNDLDRKDLLLDEDNLIALCSYHHHKIHNELKKPYKGIN